MRRVSPWILPLLLAVLVGGWAAWVELSGRAFLPRHTSARDLPYAYAAPQFAGEPFNRSMTDAMNLLYPDVVFAHGEFKAGRFPLWNDGILGGVPHAANPLTATFYPTTLLCGFLPPLRFLLWNAAFHVLLAGVAFHVFLLAAGTRPLAATFGAVGFAFCGWMTAHLHNTPLCAVIAWIPFGLAGIEWALAGRRRLGTCALALSVAMQWLAGFPQFAVIGTLTLAAYALVSLAAIRPEPLLTRRAAAGRILGAALIGLLLACVQLAVTLEARTRAARSGAPREQLVHETFEPGVFAGVALPSWLGGAHEKPVTEVPLAADEHNSRYLAARLLLGAGPAADVELVNSFGERTIYAGAGVVLLGLIGLLAARRRPAFAITAAAILAGVFACGLLPPDGIMRVAGLNVGAPGRAVLVIALAMPALAAFGLDRLLDPARRGPLAWALLRAGALLLGVIPFLAAALAYVARDAMLLRACEFLRALGAASAMGVTEDPPVDTYVEALGPAFARLRDDVFWFSGFVIATWLAAEWVRRATAGTRGACRLACTALVALLIVDLGAFFARNVKPVSARDLYPETPAIRFLQSERAHGRFMRVSADRTTAVQEMHVTLPPNMGLVHGLADAQGFREIVPRRYLDVLDGVAAFTSNVGVSAVALADVPSPAVSLVSARWLVAPAPLEDAPDFAASGLRRVALDGAETRPAALRDVVVYENPRALPLAYVVPEADVLPDGEALRALREGARDPTRVVAVDRLPGDAAPGGSGGDVPPGAVTSVRMGGGSISVDATVAHPAYVVIGATWDPGWRARLWHGPWQEDKGGALDVVRANGAFMAVRIPAGHHTIKLDYRPSWLTAGIGGSAFGALILLLWIAWPRRADSIDVRKEARDVS